MSFLIVGYICLSGLVGPGPIPVNWYQILIEKERNLIPVDNPAKLVIEVSSVQFLCTVCRALSDALCFQ